MDSFTPPPGAQVIAESSAGPQAYRLGAMLALQFHPEVSTRIVRRWGESGTAEAAKHGLDFEAIIGQSEALDAQSRERCHRLVDAFLVGLVS